MLTLGVFLNFSPPYIETELLISLIRLLWPCCLLQAPLFLPPVCWITEKTYPLMWVLGNSDPYTFMGDVPPTFISPAHLNSKPRVLSWNCCMEYQNGSNWHPPSQFISSNSFSLAAPQSIVWETTIPASGRRPRRSLTSGCFFQP